MELRRTVEIQNAEGFHARPCHAFVSKALEFKSELRVSLSGDEVNGKSIMELMTLRAASGSRLELTARGEDAQALIDALVALVGRGFGET